MINIVITSSYSSIYHSLNKLLVNIYRNIMLKKARDLLKDVYSIIYKNDHETYMKELEKLESLSDKELKDKINNDEIYIYVKPFKEPSLEDIEAFANKINIPLDEKLVLPSHNNIVTQHPAPVGLI